MWINRIAGPLVLQAARSFPALLVGGPRQAGKTSLLRRLFPEASYVTLDVPSAAEQAEKAPAAFLDSLKWPAIIDEVQYAPSLFRHLKIHIDRDRRNGRFLLTGSQVFPMMRGATESLAGRCALISLRSLGAAELAGEPRRAGADDLGLLLRGGYPQLWADPALDPALFFSSYLATYLERDVRNLLHVGKLRDFERFVRAAAARTGQILSFADLARDVGVAVSTARDWLSVLEASHQVFLLEPYFRNHGKRLVKSPKLYWTDTGLACFLAGISTRDQLLASPLVGPLWETFVVNQALRNCAFAGVGPALWYWRTRDGHEVDIVLQDGGKLWIAEAKAAENPDAGDARSLERFIAVFGEAAVSKAHVVCRTPRDFPLTRKVQAVGGRAWPRG